MNCKWMIYLSLICNNYDQLMLFKNVLFFIAHKILLSIAEHRVSDKYTLKHTGNNINHSTVFINNRLCFWYKNGIKFPI